MRGFLVTKVVAELRIPIVRTARNVHTKYGAFLLVLARAYRMNIWADRSAIESDFGPDPHLGGRSDAASQACNTTTVATLFGWQNDGVWTLQLERREAFDRFNELPALACSNMDLHIENLKAFSAQWHANVTEGTIMPRLL